MGTLLDDATLTTELGNLDGWVVVTPEGTPVLANDFRFDDFAGSMAFVNRVAEIAEDLDHHPDISISGDTVRLMISSHADGGITDDCVTLAERIDALRAG